MKAKRRDDESFISSVWQWKCFTFPWRACRKSNLPERKDTDSFHIPQWCDSLPLPKAFIGEWLAGDDPGLELFIANCVGISHLACEIFFFLNVHSLLRVKNNISLQQSRPYESPLLLCGFVDSLCASLFIVLMTVYFQRNEKKFLSVSFYAFLIKRIKECCCAKVYSGCWWDILELSTGQICWKLFEDEAHLRRWIGQRRPHSISTSHCNPIMWLLKRISLPISLCFARLRRFFAVASSCVRYCVYANFGLLVHILHCFMTLMYERCCMLRRCDSGDLEKIEFYLNEGVTQRKLLHNSHEKRCSSFLLHSQPTTEIKIIFPLCTNFNFFSSSHCRWFRGAK